VLRQILQQIFKLVSFYMATDPETCFNSPTMGMLQHWRIQAWANPAAEPLTKSRGWSRLREAVCLRHGGELSWKQHV